MSLGGLTVQILPLKKKSLFPEACEIVRQTVLCGWGQSCVLPWGSASNSDLLQPYSTVCQSSLRVSENIDFLFGGRSCSVTPLLQTSCDGLRQHPYLVRRVDIAHRPDFEECQ